MTLTAKQAAFVREYLVDLNATQAAIRAGYSKATAAAIGAENLIKPKIANEIESALQRRAERVEVKADDVLRELLRLARVDIGEAFDADGKFKQLDQMPEDVRRAICGIEVEELYEGFGKDRTQIGHTKKIKLWPKVQALELLGKHLKLFTEKHEHSGMLFLESLTDEQLRERYRVLVGKPAEEAMQ